MRLALVPALLALATGCVFVDHDHDHGGTVTPVPVNSAPVVTWASAWCAWSDYDRDDVITFEANVSDADGLGDIVAVWADVYDERSGTRVDTFELYPTDDPTYWYSDWLVSSTNLSCTYPGYVVDVTVYDSLDASGVTSIYPDTYR